MEPKDCQESIECRVLAALQDGLPVSETPYRDVAEAAGVYADALLEVLRRWRRDGTLRRIGAVVNHVRVGVAESAMVVWKVPPDRTGEVGTLFAGFAEVSHAYERRTPPSWPYSIYTMVHGATSEAVGATIERMSEAAGVVDYAILSTRRELKKAAPKYIA